MSPARCCVYHFVKIQSRTSPVLRSRVGVRPSPRDSAPKPRVAPLLRARAGLPWVSVQKNDNPKRGCASFSNLQWHDREDRTEAQHRWGWFDPGPLPRVARSFRLRCATTRQARLRFTSAYAKASAGQADAARATLGWRMQSRWDWEPPVGAALKSALPAAIY